MKRKFLLSLALIGSLVAAGCQTIDFKKESEAAFEEVKETSSNIKVSQMHGDLTVYDTLEDVEENSEYIVQGKLIDTKFDQVYDGEGNPAHSRMLSTFEVYKSFKGDLKKKEKITVVEPYEVTENTFTSLEGYNKMKKNKKYTLFLFKSTKGNYVLTGVSLGKYDMENNKKAVHKDNVENYSEIEDVEYFGHEDEKFNKFKEKVKKKYNG